MGANGASDRTPRRKTFAGTATLLLSLSLMAACGGTLDEGAGAQGAAAGTVAGFGSVTVDGVRYDNNAADVVIGGVRGFSIDNLDVGMRVTVRGPFNDAARTGTAQTILVEREIRGPLDNNGIDNAQNTIRVMGQTVAVNPATWFAGFDNLFALQALQPDNASRPALEVHGMRDGLGTVHATFVRKVADNAALADNVFLRGVVSGHDFAAKTFRIGGQFVDYAAAVLVLPPPLTRLADNLVVDVTGTDNAFGGAGTLSASRIEVDNVQIGRPGDRAKLDGYVISGTPSSFAMSGPRGPVAVAAPGVTPSGAPFAAGARVVAEGTLSGAALNASRLAVRRPNAVVIEGAVLNINAAQKTFSMVGKTVAADGFTEYRDAASGLRTFGFDGVTGGATIRIAGSFDDAANKVSATRLERTSLAVPSPSSRVTVQAPVGFVNAPGGTFTLLGPLSVGITVFGGFANTSYFGAGHVPVADRATFLAAVSVGTVVRVRGGIFTAGAPGTITEPAGGSSMEVEIVRIND